MKKIAPLLLMLLLPAFLYAQDIQKESRGYLGRLGVSAANITRIIDIQLKTRTEVQQNRLQLNVLKAELERALFPVNVDMRTVRTLLDQSLQWKMKSELALIQERVALRKILGDYRYAEYMHFFHNALGRTYGRPYANRNKRRGR